MASVLIKCWIINEKKNCTQQLDNIQTWIFLNVFIF